MFEKSIQEVLNVRGQGRIASEFGARFFFLIRHYSRLRPEQLTFRNVQFAHIKLMSDTLDLPIKFIIALLRYNKFKEE